MLFTVAVPILGLVLLDAMFKRLPKIKERVKPEV
jgi:hypothetical protein